MYNIKNKHKKPFSFDHRRAMSEKQKNPYVYFQLKPFKENELGLGHWDTVMRNLASL